MGLTGHRNFQRRRPEPALRNPADYPVRPRIVVIDAALDINAWARERRRHHPAAATIWPTGSAATIPSIASDVLTGLGKRTDLTTLKHRSEQVAAAWLAHGEATDILILEAQDVSGWFVNELLGWFCGLGVTPWLIYAADVDDTVTASAETVAHDWGVSVTDEAELRATFPDVTPAPTKKRSLRGGLPRLPRCDGIVFRSQCKALLPPAQFKRVDARFVEQVTAIRFEVQALRNQRRHHRAKVCQVLRDHLEQASTTEEIVLVSRAAQVAVIPCGWNLRVDTAMLIAAAEALPRAAKSNSSVVWETLNEYRDPDVGAIAALHLAGLTWTKLPDLTVDDVFDGPEALTVAGRKVDEPGARFVRVLATYRHLVGWEPGDSLFVTHRLNGVHRKFGHRMLTAVAAETGVQIADLSMGPKASDAEAWLRRYGLTLTNLGNLPKAARS